MLHLESQPASPTALYAFKGLGHACVRRPERVGRCRALLDRSLKPEANEKSKLQALVNLRLLLGAEEERLRALRAAKDGTCLLYTSPSPRDQRGSRMPSSA